MNPVKPGHLYGSIAVTALLVMFVIEPQRGMPEQICDALSFWQTALSVFRLSIDESSCIAYLQATSLVAL